MSDRKPGSVFHLQTHPRFPAACKRSGVSLVVRTPAALVALPEADTCTHCRRIAERELPKAQPVL